MANNNTTSVVRVDICGVLLILFITLKLCGVIQWPWLWVLAPVWIPIVLVVAMVAAILLALLALLAVISVILAIEK
jgi:hypothetical protein